MTMLIPIRDHNPTRHTPIVTIVLIAINVWVFLSIGVSEQTVFHYGAVPCDVLGKCVGLSRELDRVFPGRSSLFSVVTSMFMHGSFLHLAFNMLFLWVFGNNVEDRLNRIGFVAFYFACGIVAAGAHIGVFGSSQTPVVGASGAISGVLGAYVVMFPHARVVSLVPMIFFFFVEVPAGLLIGLWFAMQILGGLSDLGSTPQGGAGVAFLAHVGGFVSGWVIVKVLGIGRQRIDGMWPER